jgi:hypothetical protein
MDTLSSLNLTIRSIISKLKQKYLVDNSSDDAVGSYIKLLYLKEINPKFIELQQQYEMFSREFFN